MLEAVTKNKLTMDVTYKNKMKTYCMKCRKYTENIDPKMVRTKNNRLIMQSICGIKKSRFVSATLLKEQEAKKLLSNLGTKTSLSKNSFANSFVLNAIPLSCTCLKDISCKQRIKLNEIVNTFLLVEDKLIPEMHFKQLGLTYSACGPFTKKQRENQKIYANWKYRF